MPIGFVSELKCSYRHSITRGVAKAPNRVPHALHVALPQHGRLVKRRYDFHQPPAPSDHVTSGRVVRVESRSYQGETVDHSFSAIHPMKRFRRTRRVLSSTLRLESLDGEYGHEVIVALSREQTLVSPGSWTPPSSCPLGCGIHPLMWSRINPCTWMVKLYAGFVAPGRVCECLLSGDQRRFTAGSYLSAQLP